MRLMASCSTSPSSHCLQLTIRYRSHGAIMVYVLLAVLLVGLALIASGLRIVPQKRTLIIERLGKFHARADAGVNLIVPVLDRGRAGHGLREQINNIEPQSVITKDNVTMEVDAVIYYLIADPVRATYEVQNLSWGLEQIGRASCRERG